MIFNELYKNTRYMQDLKAFSNPKLTIGTENTKIIGNIFLQI